MPLFFLARFVTSLLSLLILGAAGYLLWSWYAGEVAMVDLTHVIRYREPWRLGVGLALLAWSFFGGHVLKLPLAKRDVRPTRAVRGEGEVIQGQSGSQLYIERHGPTGASPIIFTHGWGMDSTFWNYAKADLGERFQLILWDLPGLGRSKLPPSGKAALEVFAIDLEGLVTGLGDRKPVLVGHSIGGMTIQTLVRDRPEIMQRLAGVVLLDTTYTNPLRTMILNRLALALRPVLELAMRLTIWLEPLVWAINWQSYLSGSAHLAHRLGFGRHVTRSQLDHATLLSTRNRPAVEAKGNLAMFRWDATGAFGRLSTPALVIAGDMDIVTKLEANRAIAAESRMAELRIIEGANHLGPLESAETYNRWIAEFVLAAHAAGEDRPAAEGQDGTALPSGSGRFDSGSMGDARPL